MHVSVIELRNFVYLGDVSYTYSKTYVDDKRPFYRSGKLWSGPIIQDADMKLFQFIFEILNLPKSNDFVHCKVIAFCLVSIKGLIPRASMCPCRLHQRA